MKLCPECTAVANAKMLEDRIAAKGISERENNKWAQRYNAAHKKHAAPTKRRRKVAA